MNRVYVLLAVAAVLGCPAAFAQQDDVEVTLRVLDDVSDVEGVVLSIEEESESDTGDAEAQEQAGAEDLASREEEETDETPDRELDRELNREDGSEGGVEDFDVPEIVEPEEPEAPEEPDV
jgi:hypothetical protein